MFRHSPFFFLLAAACGSSDEEMGKLVVDAFSAANPPGTVGAELGGKGVWYSAIFLDPDCLTSRDLAHADDPSLRPTSAAGIPRMSPRYETQNWITYSTPKGWCLYLGENPKINVEGVRKIGNYYEVDTVVSVENPSPYWTCMTDGFIHRVVEVRKGADAKYAVNSPVDLHQGGCPVPLPGGFERKPSTRPSIAPPHAPAPAHVEQLISAFDKALFQRQFEAALALVSCVNLFEKSPWGSCSVGELVALGPSIERATGPEHGVPWLEGAISAASDLGEIRRDSADPTLYHVTVVHQRTKRPRTLAVQWVDGQWKLLGVVGQKGEGLTSMRFLYDLDQRDRREVFERRLAGEQVDELGNPLDPSAAPAAK